MINAFLANLTTTAEKIVDAAGTDGDHPRFVHLSTASADIYLGGSTVDSTDGYPMGTATTPLVILLQPGDDLYAIAGSGTPTVRVMVTRADATTTSI
jgi:hypothetical protein